LSSIQRLPGGLCSPCAEHTLGHISSGLEEAVSACRSLHNVLRLSPNQSRKHETIQTVR